MIVECLILTIGIKGIDNQSIALAKALGLKYKITHINVNPLLKNFPFLGSFFFNFFSDQIKLIEKYNFKYLITTGKKLSGVTVALKKKLGKRIINIHLQKPSFQSIYFDIIITPEHDNFYTQNNHIKIIGSLSPFDEKDIEKHFQYIKDDFKKFNPPNILILLGGTSKRYKPTNTDYCKLLIKAREAVKKISGNIIICTSRRTPKKVLYLSKKILSKFPNKVVISDDTNKNIYPGIIKISDFIIVTNDSVNMVSEIATTPKKLFIGYLNEEKSKIKSFHDKLQRLKIIEIFDDSLFNYEKVLLENNKKLNADFLQIIKKLSK